jgi:hypothetical protein
MNLPIQSGPVRRQKRTLEYLGTALPEDGVRPLQEDETTTDEEETGAEGEAGGGEEG